MSSEVFEMLMGWSAERIELFGMTREFAWEMWRRRHPILSALLDGASYAGVSMISRPLIGPLIGR